MSEKKYTRLPTTVEEAEAAAPAPAYTEVAENEATTVRRRKLRTGFLKLSLFAFLFYIFFWPMDSEGDQDNDNKWRSGRRHGKNKGGCHGDKKDSKVTFESHMQADIDLLIAGSLESRYAVATT